MRAERISISLHRAILFVLLILNIHRAILHCRIAIHVFVEIRGVGGLATSNIARCSSRLVLLLVEIAVTVDPWRVRAERAGLTTREWAFTAVLLGVEESLVVLGIFHCLLPSLRIGLRRNIPLGFRSLFTCRLPIEVIVDMAPLDIGLFEGRDSLRVEVRHSRLLLLGLLQSHRLRPVGF